MIYAYCFMGNHVHLLLKVGDEPLEQIMRRIGGSYVYWYNHKYERIGNLFQDRFKSEPVETDAYFLTVLRYIHQNPVKAGMVDDISAYEWSSYGEYTGEKKLIEREEVLGMLSPDPSVSIREFKKFMAEHDSSECLDVKENKRRATDGEAKRIIEERLGIKPVMVQREPLGRKKEMIGDMLKIEGISTRQLARITGLSANLVWRASREGEAGV